ncbi:MAG: hypothetical protein RL685_6350 [Pseudomonadota bacterium]
MDRPLTSDGPARFAPSRREHMQLRRYGFKIALFSALRKLGCFGHRSVKGTSPAYGARRPSTFLVVAAAAGARARLSSRAGRCASQALELEAANVVAVEEVRRVAVRAADRLGALPRRHPPRHGSGRDRSGRHARLDSGHGGRRWIGPCIRSLGLDRSGRYRAAARRTGGTTSSRTARAKPDIALRQEDRAFCVVLIIGRPRQLIALHDGQVFVG